jgi:prepilin-type N-terminal cleavage/methylation domain-containing protein
MPIRAHRTGTARLGKDAGFTLIELVLVVTIILVMTSIIGPTFRVTPTRQVENMAQLIVAHLELARTEALGNREMIRVDFDLVARTYTAYADDDGDGAVTGAAAEIAAFPEFGTRTLDDLVTFGRGTSTALPGDTGSGEVTFANDRFTLDNQGIPTPWGTMGTIYLTHARDASAVAAISVASSGSFKAWRWWPDAGEWR